MKIYFETNQGTEFDMEVGDINSLQQLKEKIQTEQGIPVSKQTLWYSGNIIGSDAELLSADIEEGSIIFLQISDVDQEDSPPTPLPSPTPPTPPPSPLPQEMTIALKMVPPFNTIFETVHANDTPKTLKRRVQKVVEGTTAEHLGIMLRDELGRELPDDKTLLQCRILPHSVVTVDLVIPEDDQTSTAASAGNKEGKAEAAPVESQGSSDPGIRISVVVSYREIKTTVEVWADQEVRQVRRKLQKMTLPDYFLIHNQQVLDENLSFTLQNIVEGDVIQVLPDHFS